MSLAASAPWPHRGRPGPRQAPLLLALAAAHVALAWALWQQGAERELLRETAPLAVRLLTVADGRPAAPALALPAPAPPPSPRPPPPAPVPELPPLALPSPVPLASPPPLAPPSAPPTPPLSAEPAVAAPGPTTVAAAPAPAPAAPAAFVAAADAMAADTPLVATRELPTSAVQYLVAPQLIYPRAARRLHQTGRVLVRIWISTAGLPERLQLARSSGFALLDDAALAAVRGARFKPYIDNGQPTAGWAVVPLRFDLDS